MPSPTPDPLPSLRDLASSDPSLRRKNLTTVLTHLSTTSSSQPLDATQCLQLWRAFSVALYMHDTKNMLSVQKLIATLAGTVKLMADKDRDVIKHRQPENKDDKDDDGISSNGNGEWKYLTQWNVAFWETLSREWSGIDQWRMNKYLLLIRWVVRELFEVFFSERAIEVREGLERTQLEVLEMWPLSTRERKVPDGLRLHVLDVWVEEMERARERAEAQEEEKVEVEGIRESEESGSAKTKKRKRKSNDEGGREGKKQNGDAVVAANAETVTKLIQPIRRLAKEALGKGVKMKAREIVKEFDAEQAAD